MYEPKSAKRAFWAWRQARAVPKAARRIATYARKIWPASPSSSSASTYPSLSRNARSAQKAESRRRASRGRREARDRERRPKSSHSSSFITEALADRWGTYCDSVGPRPIVARRRARRTETYRGANGIRGRPEALDMVQSRGDDGSDGYTRRVACAQSRGAQSLRTLSAPYATRAGLPGVILSLRDAPGCQDAFPPLEKVWGAVAGEHGGQTHYYHRLKRTHFIDLG